MSTMPHLVAASALLSALLTALPVGASERRDFPCPGCITWVPAPQVERPPLLLALHGDGGAPDRMIGLLRAEAARRGYALLAPACPRRLGCDGSWWRWAGSPAWLSQQVAAVADAMPLDRRRVYLLGWSGGASYLAYLAADLPEVFAAVALAGGGMQPRAGPCAPHPRPVWLLSGDRNPLHHLAQAAHQGLAACGHQVRWLVLPGADHDGEWSALQRRQPALFDFFASHALDLSPAPALHGSDAPRP